MGIEPTALLPSRSAVRRTNYCATALFPKKNGLNAAYIMRSLLRHSFFARCYHRRCPTLLLVFGKVREKSVRDQVIEVVDISSVQHSFGKRHSDVTFLLVMENFVAESLNKQSVDIISFDFSRAFDKVLTGSPATRTKQTGHNGSGLQWVHNVLTNLTQIVRTTALASSAPVSS